jgi:hypothetical protein
MVELAEIQFAYYMLAATGVLVGAIYYILSLRYNMKVREMEICRVSASDYASDQGMQRYAIMMTMEWKDYEDFVEKYGYSHPEMFGKWASQFFMWEALGTLLKRKIIKAETIYVLGGYGAIAAWKKYKDIVQRERGRSVVDYLSNAEFFAQEMLKVRTRNEARAQVAARA